MKLPEHVDLLRNMITAAFDKQFSRLGIGTTRKLELEKIPQELHARRQRFEDMFQSHLGETGSYESAREKLIDELTFTLFNRIAAVKVMEAASLFPPIITKQPEHGDRSFGHKAWLEIRPDMRSEELEGIREYIQYAFNELGDTLPLYSRSYPYSLLPDPISLNEIIDAFNAVEKDPQVGEDIWQSDDVLGWLYESYNNAKKAEFKDSGDKVEYDKVSLQSQVYTPLWVVQFLVDNSLGKLYLEMYPDSDIKNRYKIANAPETQERELKPLHEVKLIDPACGSGNFLLYAFDLFYELYLDQIENYGAGYDEEKIPSLILEHNLHGIDLDDRAVQLAQLGLYIKARKKRRTVSNLQFNVVSSDFFLPDYDNVRHIFEDGTALDRNQKSLIAEVWGDLQLAYKFGSLIRLDEKIKSRLRELISKREKIETQPKMFPDDELGVKPKPVQRELFLEGDIEQERVFAEKFFFNLKTAVEQYAKKQGNSFLTSKTRDAVAFLELLNSRFDVATTNPPYTDSADFGSELKIFIENNFKKPFKFHPNLYATFIKRCYDLTLNDGKIAMIHPLTFMYIKTFEGVRKYIVKNTNIDILIEFGLGGVFLTTKVDVDVAAYVLSKNMNGRSEKLSYFMNLQRYKGLKIKQKIFEKAYEDFLNEKDNEHNFFLPQSKIKIIETWPFIYWISDQFREKFGAEDVKSLLSPAQGAATTNNLRFLRFWWEVGPSKISKNYLKDRKKWVTYSKGGPFEKWYGNLWLVGNYENDAAEMKSIGAVLRNSHLYFSEGVTYSASGSKGVSFRYLPENCFFDTGGSCIFANKEFKNNYYLLGFMNSKLVSYIIECLNPTVNAQVGDMQRVPFVLPTKAIEKVVTDCVIRNIEIKTRLGLDHLMERNSTQYPFVSRSEIIKYLQYENYLNVQIIINEAVINEKIFTLYDLSKFDKAMVLTKEGESIGGLPVMAAAKAAYLAEIEAHHEFILLDIAHDFIDSLPTNEFTTEERENIESGFQSLYQSNNNLEDFCIRHQTNPINVWYWFNQSNIIPQQRMYTFALEFLADIIREALLEDEDGIIPLVPNAGEKLLLEHIEDKFRKKGFSMAHFSQFDMLLGRSINDYLNNYFFSELSNYLNLFRHLPMTPFIWHLSSGPEQGFDCYIIIYKWSRDKLMRIRSVYIERRERALINRQSDLAGNDSVDAQNEKDKIRNQLTEIETFKKKIDELLAEGYDPILDDGVGKNIAPLQKKKMIPYEVLSAGQLKKYLNADW